MKILIVGAGIGGLSLAAFLEDSNIEYDIVEKAADWTHRGYLIGLWHNGRHMLKKLGLADRFDALGTPIHTYSIRNGAGKVLRNYDLSSFYVNYGTGVTFIYRADLHDILLSKVQKSRIQMTTTVQYVRQSDHTVHVAFSGGRSAEYDLVVGADGVHSSIREMALAPHAEVYRNWRLWCAWIDNAFDNKATVTEYVEPGEYAFTFSARGKTLLWLSAPRDHSMWDTPQGRVQRLLEIFKAESKLIPGALEKLRDEDILPTDLIEVNVHRWIKGRIVLLGDAAHTYGPYAGVGASMAMEDAYVLAGELMQISDQYTLKQALAMYEKKRKRRVHIAHRLNHKLRTWTLIKSKPLRWLVNLLVPYGPEWYFVSDYAKLMREEI